MNVIGSPLDCPTSSPVWTRIASAVSSSSSSFFGVNGSIDGGMIEVGRPAVNGGA